MRDIIFSCGLEIEHNAILGNGCPSGQLIERIWVIGRGYAGLGWERGWATPKVLVVIGRREWFAPYGGM